MLVRFATVGSFFNASADFPSNVLTRSTPLALLFMAAASSSKAKLGSTGGPTTQTTSWTRIFKIILREKSLAWQATSSHQDEIQVIEDTVDVINDENVDDFPLPDDLNDVSKLFFILPLNT